ncbi:DUF3653 domain-containing protein [Photobacterium kishitanii]|uniref:DUF3653 domain-containing protein n=1 Tax=Photobacterium kishitanii TaxID=318456 RepID=UPI000433989B|nr:conserved hypothetical protein [Photobacterium kishitanii]
MKEMTPNVYFRMYICGLTVEKTAELCFKSVSTVTKWDRGRTIPPICKRLMKLYANRRLDAVSKEWRGWMFNKGELITPNGWSLTPNQIFMGNALIEIGTDNDRALRAEIMRVARLIKNVPSH